MLHIESKLIYNDHVSFVTFVNVKTNYKIKLRINFSLLFNKHLNKRITVVDEKIKINNHKILILLLKNIVPVYLTGSASILCFNDTQEELRVN